MYNIIIDIQKNIYGGFIMSKANVTNKWVKEKYTCISIGYCDLQNLLKFESPIYYTCGVYGWNYDVYAGLPSVPGHYNIAICTGYRGMPENTKTAKEKHSIIRKYEEKAMKFYNDNWKTMDYEDIRTVFQGYIKDFLTELLEA